MNRKDLVVLVADQDMGHALRGLFTRPQRLGIREIEADIRVHLRRDPGCAGEGVDFLSNFSKEYRYGLLMFDHKGSGKEKIEPWRLQEDLNKKFARSTWSERARAIVVSPELEAWVWSDSSHVDDVAGWKSRQPPLRRWLVDQGLLREDASKPDRPKEAFQAALREARIPRSASLYKQIAERVSLERCKDRSFGELKDILRSWFPPDSL